MILLLGLLDLSRNVEDIMVNLKIVIVISFIFGVLVKNVVFMRWGNLFKYVVLVEVNIVIIE